MYMSQRRIGVSKRIHRSRAHRVRRSDRVINHNRHGGVNKHTASQRESRIRDKR